MVIGPTPLSLSDISQFPARDQAERAALFEHLLLFDTVSVKVYEENIPPAVMLKLFGEKGLEALLEQEAIRFVLWTPLITYNVTEHPGINALQSGVVNSDPERSVELGLNFLTEKPSKQLMKRLKKKVLPLYELPSPKLAAKTVELTNSALVQVNLSRSVSIRGDTS